MLGQSLRAFHFLLFPQRNSVGWRRRGNSRRRCLELWRNAEGTRLQAQMILTSPLSKQGGASLKRIFAACFLNYIKGVELIER